MYKKILVPLDGSEFGECSIPHVKAIATGCSVPEVVLLRAIEPIPSVGGYLNKEWVEEAGKKAETMIQKYLTNMAATLKSEGVAASVVIVKGNAADEILTYAAKNQVDLIIMGTHGSSGVVRWVLGSVADRVVRHASSPVLVVAPEACRTG